MIKTPRITPALMEAIRQGYSLPWRGIHGVTHWARVLENGLRLADRTGANRDVIQLFAVLHDARRWNEDADPDHGRRGAALAEKLRGSLFHLPNGDFELLHDACSYHTEALTHPDVTVQTCFDADRLDLPRVGIEPDLKYLSTEAARDPVIIDWASGRSIAGHIPPFLSAWDVP
jgi:uncharacterized protein